MDDASKLKFKKLGSAANTYGVEFENLIVSLLSIRLADHPEIFDFKIYSNPENHGKFDDVILKIEHKNGEIVRYFIQQKHRQNPRDSIIKKLNDRRTDLSIENYLEQYKVDESNIYQGDDRLILFTNSKFNALDYYNIKIGESRADFFKIIPDPLINTSDVNGNCYVFDCSDCDDITKKFFNQFYLYTDQLSVETLKLKAQEEFCAKFNCINTAFDEFYKFITNWSNKTGTKYALDKKFLRLKIAELILTPFIEPPIYGETSQIFHETIQNFDITLIENDDFEIIVPQLKNEEIAASLTQLKSRFQIHNKNVNGDGAAKILWLADKFPLILKIDDNCGDAVYKAIELCDNFGHKHKFIIKSRRFRKNILPNWKVFENLSDLSRATYKNIVEKMRFSIQEKSDITLTEVFDQNPALRRDLRVNNIFNAIENHLIIDDNQEGMPDLYLKRELSRVLFDYRFLNELQSNNLIVINCETKLEEFKRKINGDTKRQNSFLSNKFAQCKFNNNSTILLTDYEISYDDFRNLIAKDNKKQNYHYFRLCSDNNNDQLEWISSESNSDFDYLRKYELSRTNFIEDSMIITTKMEQKINLICADPGMGKSVLLKHIINIYPAEFWAINVPVRGLQWKDFKSCQEFLNNLIDFKYLSDFERNLARYFVEKQRIALLWDGLDELSHEVLKIATELICKIAGLGLVQFVTSRCNLREYLEDYFGVFARSIKELNEEQKDLYIKNKLQDKLSEEELQKSIYNIKRNIGLIKYNEVFGIPLQIFMFTEILKQNPDKCHLLMKNIFSIADLYENFIEEKFNFYLDGKANLTDLNESAKRVISAFKSHYRHNYELAGLLTCFESADLDALNIAKYQCCSFLSEIHKTGDIFGIITNVMSSSDCDYNPIFLHTTYAEYFSALYLVRNYREIPHLSRVIFKERYKNIRLMFDLIIAGNSEIHIAVLYKNYDMIKKFERVDLVNNYDRGARSAAHLLSSWGSAYPVLNKVTVKNTHIVSDSQVNIKRDCVEHIDILKSLKSRPEIYRRDEIFAFDALDYADKSLNLEAVEAIANRSVLCLTKFEIFQDPISVFYYKLRFGFGEISKNDIKSLPIFITEHGSNILHLATMYKRVDFLKQILEHNRFKKLVNDSDNNGLTALHLSAQIGDLKIAQILISSGADINQKSNLPNETPLYYAAQYNHYAFVKYLIKLKARINVSYKTKAWNPIFIASNNGFLNIVKILYKNGAKINYFDNNGFTPLHIAAYKGHLSVVKYFTENRLIGVNSHNISGNTPLIFASANGFTDIVKYLLSKNANVDFNNCDGFTPLHCACLEGHYEIVDLLLKADSYIDATDLDNLTPFYVAVSQGFFDTAKLLIECGANINIPDKRGFTPLHVAVSNNRPDMVELLMQTGKIRRTLNYNQNSVLHLAAGIGSIELVKKFVFEVNIDIDLTDSQGNTALIYAAENGFKDIVQLLISLGADAHKMNIYGHTAKSIAKHNGHNDIVNFLRVKAPLI